jgi:hypothetical protein
MRKATREIVKDFGVVVRGGREERELLRDWLGWPVEAGAKMSVKVPNAIRAIVDVIATMETWVAAEVVGVEVGGYRVPIIVPRFVRKASPGPDTDVSIRLLKIFI